MGVTDLSKHTYASLKAYGMAQHGTAYLSDNAPEGEEIPIDVGPAYQLDPLPAASYPDNPPVFRSIGQCEKSTEESVSVGSAV